MPGSWPIGAWTTTAASWRPRRSPRSSSSSSTCIRSRPRRIDRGSASTSWSRRSTSAVRRWSGPAAKNHANVAIVTSPARYDAVLAALAGEGGVAARPALGTGRRGLPPHRGVRRPDRRGAAAPDGDRRRAAPGRARPARRVRSVPAHPDDRPRQGRDPALRREPAPAGGALPAPGCRGRRPVRLGRATPPGQGPELQQRPRRGRGGGAGGHPARRRLRHRQAHQPVRRRRTTDPAGRLGGRPGRRLRCRPSAGSSG